MAQKPSIPKGTRDFGQIEMAERNYIFDTIRSVFRTYGYSQIETPAMENLSTLLGKYGDEGDKLLFRILNSGDAFTGIDYDGFKLEDGSYNSKALSLKVCEKGLRYDLTVPFARFVVQHQNEISFPFKRFQIQPVWRADRPQKGRYREFYQCDVDAIGSKSQLCELELVQIVDKVFEKLGINVLVKINNRKVLAGLAEICGFPDKVVDITVAIDKLDKVGLDAVKEEMVEKGLTAEAVSILEPVLTLSGTNREKIEKMRGIMASSAEGLKGLDELEELFAYIEAAGIKTPTEIDLSLARGLNYYTGAIFEVKALDWQIGSICGGGRYDGLVENLLHVKVPASGASIGVDRLAELLTLTGQLPAQMDGPVIVTVFDEDLMPLYQKTAMALRAAGIDTEVYYGAKRGIKHQMAYADRCNCPLAVIIGGDEAAKGVASVKNLKLGKILAATITDKAEWKARVQSEIPLGALAEEIKKMLLN
mgnify:CR=1 FL=1